MIEKMKFCYEYSFTYIFEEPNKNGWTMSRDSLHQKQIFIIFFGIAWWTGTMTYAYAQENEQLTEAWQQTSRYFQGLLQKNGVVGGALLFLEQDDIVGENYYGFADLEQQRKVDKNTIFHWASITKTFTAIAIMQLRDRGLLSLDDPVVKYLPALEKVHNPYGPMDEITIRMVMSHTAGFRSPTWPWGGDEPWHPFEPTEWDQIVAMFPYTQILYEPGSKFHYSNPAIIFLGQIIERLTGDAYEVYINKNILKPLKMYHTYYDITPYHLLKYRSNSYVMTEEGPQPNGLDFDTGITASNGGLNAPLMDMIKYLSFLTGASPHKTVLERSSLEEMWQIQQFVSQNDGFKTSMGLSFFIEEFDNMRVIGHTGTQRSYLSFFYIHPPSQTACIGITNTDHLQGKLSTDQIREEISHFIFRNLFTLYK